MSTTSRRPPIDTSRFMSKYHHPKNVAAARGDPSSLATISTPYSRTHGLYRQKQVDDEIERIRAGKKPSSSKINITISATNLLTLYHHHHHCLDVQLTGGRQGKGRVVWFWEKWETATDERVMKGAIAALDESWTEPRGSDGGGYDTSARGEGSGTSTRMPGGKQQSTIGWGKMEGRNSEPAAARAPPVPNMAAKRKRAALAAESRMERGDCGKTRQNKSNVEVVDLLGDSD